MPKITNLPDADSVEGAYIELGPTHETTFVKIQYKNARSGLHEVAMDIPNALCLLDSLEDLLDDHGYSVLRSPYL